MPIHGGAQVSVLSGRWAADLRDGGTQMGRSGACPGRPWGV